MTNAGALFADQYLVRQSRVFCTVWNGNDNSGDDTIDDKEFEGNIIKLLNESAGFIKLHNRSTWTKVANGRVDRSEYAERAIFIINNIAHT